MIRAHDLPRVAAASVLLLLVSGAAQVLPAAAPSRPSPDMEPVYAWDPTWPVRPLPNHWTLGQVAGVEVDSRDHVWIVHRPRTIEGTALDELYPVPASECCIPAPSVIEFDQSGKLVQAWGGPRADDFAKTGGVGGAPIRASALPWTPPTFPWPDQEHTIVIDYRNNVWIANNVGSHIVKLTREGKFLLQIGREGVKPADRNSQRTDALNNPSGMVVDPKTNEVFVSDGYANRRVIVFDADTGAFKRQWGAYGGKPDDGVKYTYNPDPAGQHSRQFELVHCVRMDKDDLVYVCDRLNSRIQVFKKDGTFVKEVFIRPHARGTPFDLVFSKDPEQRFAYVVDGGNDKVWILRRSDMHVIGEFGRPGHFGGDLTTAHNIAVDSKNNIYVAESTEGKRVQRFLYKGMRPATRTYDAYGVVRN